MTTALISTALYIINAWVFSIFIVPQLKDIKRLQNSLYGFNLPYLSTYADETEDDRQKIQIKKYDELLAHYRVEYAAMKKMIDLLYYSVVAMLLGTLLAILASAEFILTNIDSGMSVFLATIGILSLISLHAIDRFIAAPDDLSEFSFMIKNQNISNYNLVNCASFKPTFEVREPFSTAAPKKIYLTTNFRLHGYKYLLCIFDQDYKIIYYSYGNVSKQSKVQRIEYPPIKFSSGTKYTPPFLSYRIEVGNFYYTNTNRSEMRIFLFIFDPCVQSDELENSPLYETGSMTMSDHTIGGGPPIKIKKAAKYYLPIQYRGKGAKIKRIEWRDKLESYPDKEYSEEIGDLIKEHGKRLSRSKKTIEKDWQLEASFNIPDTCWYLWFKQWLK